MNNKCSIFKKLLSVSILAILAASISACSNKHDKVKADTDPTKIVIDKGYTEELKKEKEISNGQVYVQNNTIIATMIIKDGVKKEETKALADKYAKELKNTYKDMHINVQAVQGGNNVVDVTK